MDYEHHVETIMHISFLGVGQRVGSLMKEMLSKEKLFSQFHGSENQLQTIRSLQLDWCKTWIFGSSKTPFGPWVSEK